MSIRARCASCGASFQAKDSLAGKRVKCPKCAQPITIGQPVAVREGTGNRGCQENVAASVRNT